jgi:hypothetical protein
MHTSKAMCTVHAPRATTTLQGLIVVNTLHASERCVCQHSGSSIRATTHRTDTCTDALRSASVSGHREMLTP